VLALVALILGTAVFALLAATFSAAVIPVLVLTAWIAAAGWAARRWFRWEPRR
jgi:ABC-2 type transport system permease protein